MYFKTYVQSKKIIWEMEIIYLCSKDQSVYFWFFLLWMASGGLLLSYLHPNWQALLIIFVTTNIVVLSRIQTWVFRWDPTLIWNSALNPLATTAGFLTSFLITIFLSFSRFELETLRFWDRWHTNVPPCLPFKSKVYFVVTFFLKTS